MGRANSKERLWISEELQGQRDRSVSVVETVSLGEQGVPRVFKNERVKQNVSFGR